MHAIRKASGAAKSDPPDDAFLTAPYERSKAIK
jgi:hypothetical protein